MAKIVSPKVRRLILSPLDCSASHNGKGLGVRLLRKRRGRQKTQKEVISDGYLERIRKRRARHGRGRKKTALPIRRRTWLSRDAAKGRRPAPTSHLPDGSGRPPVCADRPNPKTRRP